MIYVIPFLLFFLFLPFSFLLISKIVSNIINATVITTTIITTSRSVVFTPHIHTHNISSYTHHTHGISSHPHTLITHIIHTLSTHPHTSHTSHTSHTHHTHIIHSSTHITPRPAPHVWRVRCGAVSAPRVVRRTSARRRDGGSECSL